MVKEKKNLLVFCNNFNCIKRKIKYLKRRFNIYLISQNIEIYLNKEWNDLNDVTVLPYEILHTVFSEETWRVADTVNNSFANIRTEKPIYLYELNYSCGIGLTREYSDYLYSIALFNKIVEDYSIDIIYSEKIHYFAAFEAIKDIAKTNGKKIYSIGGLDFSFKKIRHKLYYNQNFLVRLMINFALQMVCLFKMAKTAKRNDKDLEKKKYDIGVVLTSNHNKAIRWVLEDLQELDQFNYCVFCYHADEAKKELIKLGKNAKSVEGYFNLGAALKSYFVYLRDAHRIQKQVKKIASIYFQGIDVEKTVKNLFFNHLYRQKLEDILYEEVIYGFLQNNQIHLLAGEGSSNFIANKIFYFCSRKLNMNTVIYRKDIGIEIYDMIKVAPEYEPYSFIMNLGFFGYKNMRLQMLIAEGWKGEYHCLADNEHAKKYYAVSLLRKQVLDIKKEIKVLWAPSNQFQGVYSVNSFIKDNMIILQELGKINCKLIVKYHPHQAESLVNNIIKEYRSDTIEFADQYDKIDKFIQEADIVFTTPSTVLLDAAIMGRLVICLVNDLSIELTEHLKDGFYLVKRENLNLTKILFDLNFRKKQIAKQNAFLEGKFYNPENKHIGDYLKKYIKE